MVGTLTLTSAVATAALDEAPLHRGASCVIGLSIVADVRNADGVAIVALCPALGEDHFGGPAHATLVFCGTVDDVSLQDAIKMDGLTRIMSIMQMHAFSVPVIGEAMFGEGSNERVLLFPEQGTPLTEMRYRCQYLSRSQYTQYRPHVATMQTVDRVQFTALSLWYGTKRIVHPFLAAEVETTEGEGDGSRSLRDDQGRGG